jgi:uncharacterized repeat protein (TIGR03803 family)
MVMFALLAMQLVIAVSSPAQTVTPVYSFTGNNSSGNPAFGTLAQGRNGKLYGTTYGPNEVDGSIFAMTSSGIETQTYTFGSDGTNPAGGLTLGSDGNFYGTTVYGGSTDSGVLFKLSPTGVYTVLHEFQGGSDGANPDSAPIQASDSNFYGTTVGTFDSNYASTIYRYEMNGTFTTIHNLSFSEGGAVVAPLLQGSDGNLYGTASWAGNADLCGTLFKLSTSGEMLWTYVFPCGFSGNVNGYTPYGALIQASDGNYYGTTLAGGWGGDNQGCCGVIFKLTQNGHVSVLFAPDPIEGGYLEAGLTQGTDGNLYGTASYGGDNKDAGGTLFQMSLSGTYKVLYDFGAAGARPLAAPVQDTNGTFYGTTWEGGRYGYGTVYSLNMGLGPFVAFVRASGGVGQTAQILGQGLTGATSVTFNGVPASSFTVVNDAYMTAVVPSGATTGKVVVTTPSGPLTSNVNFRIIQ